MSSSMQLTPKFRKILAAMYLRAIATLSFNVIIAPALF
jgi:hypothetical protein